MKKKLFTIRVPSKKTSGDFHNVVVFSDYSMDCNCLGKGLYKKECEHIKDMRKLLLLVFRKKCFDKLVNIC